MAGQYDFRLDILRNGIKIGEALAESAQIHFDQDADVMKGLKFDLIKTKMSKTTGDPLVFDQFKDRIRPVLILDGKETPLGVFMLVATPQTFSDVLDYTSVEAYDETMLVKQAAFEERAYYAAGTSYIAIIESILTSLGFANIEKDDSSAALSNDLEAAVGQNCLDFINSLLDSMNFQHLYADAYGTLQIRKIQNPDTPSFIYRDTERFTLLDNIRKDTDIYDLPNVVIGVYSSADRSNPVVYKKVNDDPNSIISTVNRGYKVVKKVEVRNAASLQDLTDYVERVAFEAMQTTETVEFKTLAEAGHEPNTAVQLSTEDVRGLFIERRWSISISQRDFSMTHKAERKVFL